MTNQQVLSNAREFIFEGRERSPMDCSRMMHGGLELLALTVVLFAGVVAHAQERVHFNRNVLPILADHCLACHGLDNAQREAGCS